MHRFSSLRLPRPRARRRRCHRRRCAVVRLRNDDVQSEQEDRLQVRRVGAGARGAARSDDADLRRSLSVGDRLRRRRGARSAAPERSVAVQSRRARRARRQRALAGRQGDARRPPGTRCAISGPRTASSSPSSNRRWASWKPTGPRIASTSRRVSCSSSRTSTSASPPIPTSATNSARASSAAASRARSRSTSAIAAPSRCR